MDAEKIKSKMLEITKLAEEVLAEIGDARVRVFDNGGVSFDRYTVFIGRDVFTMSGHTLSPQGVNQWAGSCAGNIAVLEPGVIPALGDELRSDQVPPEVREAIEQRRESTRFNEGG